FLTLARDNPALPSFPTRRSSDLLKTLHIADGTGEAENHWFPCDYKGENNWDKVLAALSEVNYQGPFMYESSAPGLKAYKLCYQEDRKSTRLNSSHVKIAYAVFCL